MDCLGKSQFKVTITETLEHFVYVMADDGSDAEQMVSGDWKNGKHVLSAENFSGVEFFAAAAEAIASEDGGNNSDERIY
jgi:hypothetical protein